MRPIDDYVSGMTLKFFYQSAMVEVIYTLMYAFIVLHYHLQVQANPKKKWHKKTDAIFSIYGKNGINHDIFFNSHLGLSRSLRPKEAA